MPSPCFSRPCFSLPSRGHLCRAFAYRSMSFQSHAIAELLYPMPLLVYSMQILRRSTRLSAVQFPRKSYPRYAIPQRFYSMLCLGKSLRSVPEPLLLYAILCRCDAVHLLAKPLLCAAYLSTMGCATPLPVSSFHAGQCLCLSKLGVSFADQCGARPCRSVP